MDYCYRILSSDHITYTTIAQCEYWWVINDKLIYDTKNLIFGTSSEITTHCLNNGLSIDGLWLSHDSKFSDIYPHIQAFKHYIHQSKDSTLLTLSYPTSTLATSTLATSTLSSSTLATSTLATSTLSTSTLSSSTLSTSAHPAKIESPLATNIVASSKVLSDLNTLETSVDSTNPIVSSINPLTPPKDIAVKNIPILNISNVKPTTSTPEVISPVKITPVQIPHSTPARVKIPHLPSQVTSTPAANSSNTYQSPPNISQSPPNTYQSPTNISQSPPNISQSPTNISQSPTNTYQSPDNISQSSANKSNVNIGQSSAIRYTVEEQRAAVCFYERFQTYNRNSHNYLNVSMLNTNGKNARMRMVSNFGSDEKRRVYFNDVLYICSNNLDNYLLALKFLRIRGHDFSTQEIPARTFFLALSRPSSAQSARPNQTRTAFDNPKHLLPNL